MDRFFLARDRNERSRGRSAALHRRVTLWLTADTEKRIIPFVSTDTREKEKER